MGCSVCGESGASHRPPCRVRDGVLLAPVCTSIEECDEQLLEHRRLYLDAVEEGRDVEAFDEHARLDDLLDQRIHLPLQRGPSD